MINKAPEIISAEFEEGFMLLGTNIYNHTVSFEVKGITVKYNILYL